MGLREKPFRTLEAIDASDQLVRNVFPWRASPQQLGIRRTRRFHQTLKRFLDRQAPAASLAHLQLQLDAFRTYYNQQRPHRAAAGRTPFEAFQARLKAAPSLPAPPVQYRVRHDRLDSGGKVSLRYLGRLRHIWVSYSHRSQPVTLLVAGDQVRVVSQDGELLRELTIDPTRIYQALRPRPPVYDVATQSPA